MTHSRDPQGFSEDNGPERVAGNDAPAETKPAEQLTEAEKAKKARRQRMLPLIFILLGVLCLAYPITSTVWNNHQTKLVSRAYENHVNNQSQELKDSYIARAREYNATHKGFPVLDPFLGDTAPDSTEYREYLSVLDQPSGIIGVVKIPKIEVKLPMRHGTEHDTLNAGAGHMFGTDLPVGGVDRHTVITAHTGLPNSTMFDRLTDLKIGDEFFFEVQDQSLAYRVTRIDVVEPNDPSLLGREKDKDLATLLTCTPYGINSHRLLVTGERIIPTPMSPAVDGTQWSWWMTLFLLAILISLLLAARVARYLAARRKKEREEEGTEVPESLAEAELA
ncbi:sortase [Propionimicrobium lymphophilum ACS-093-V-SCH5]|uniref:Sortase n=1 Tax=Propionimicrobium lymphophilum ACS-093-V-SCH5 TaxID=883161 RepID=S2WZ43_9ACTN|nr:class C sortase [Propionimicrobium lymphophilum]EPD33019.1 sortase [Propionimicrobium lymphophilum ACS-093-V-SCH5]